MIWSQTPSKLFFYQENSAALFAENSVAMWFLKKDKMII